MTMTGRIAAAALMAGGVMAAAIGGAAAMSGPVAPLSDQLRQINIANPIENIHYRPYRHWHRNRHGRRYRYRRPGYYYYGGWWYATPWWTLPLVVQPAPPARVNRRRAHVRWCLNRYRSYNPRTDTFMGFDGRRRYCRSPY